MNLREGGLFFILRYCENVQAIANSRVWMRWLPPLNFTHPFVRFIYLPKREGGNEQHTPSGVVYNILLQTFEQFIKHFIIFLQPGIALCPV